MQGVVSVNGEVDTKKVIVSFEDPATQPKIEELLAEIDYPVQK